jgi:hypothetical protein
MLVASHPSIINKVKRLHVDLATANMAGWIVLLPDQLGNSTGDPVDKGRSPLSTLNCLRIVPPTQLLFGSGSDQAQIGLVASSGSSIVRVSWQPSIEHVSTSRQVSQSHLLPTRRPTVACLHMAHISPLFENITVAAAHCRDNPW